MSIEFAPALQERAYGSDYNFHAPPKAPQTQDDVTEHIWSVTSMTSNMHGLDGIHWTRCSDWSVKMELMLNKLSGNDLRTTYPVRGKIVSLPLLSQHAKEQKH